MGQSQAKEAACHELMVPRIQVCGRYLYIVSAFLEKENKKIGTSQAQGKFVDHSVLKVELEFLALIRYNHHPQENLEEHSRLNHQYSGKQERLSFYE